jgi:hypothetical protein
MLAKKVPPESRSSGGLTSNSPAQSLRYCDLAKPRSSALELAWEEDRRKSRSIEAPCRRIGDFLSWKLSLDPTGVITGIPEIVLDYSCFEVLKNDERYEDEEEEIQNPHYLIRAKAFVSCVLKYKFKFSRARSYEKYAFQSRGQEGIEEDFGHGLAPGWRIWFISSIRSLH